MLFALIKLEDMIGMKFSNWTVIEYSHRTKGRKHIFKCRCKCGTVKAVYKDNLVYGKSKSCGCLNGVQEDIIGEKYGRLTILELTNERQFGNKVMNCLCDCGKEHKVSMNALKSGSIKSCGCSISPDLIGQIFGRLTVIENLGAKEYGKQFFLCQCDCGEKVKVSRTGLNAGWKKSCGCLKRESGSKNLMKTLSLRSGKNHYNYNPLITDEERVKNRYSIYGEDRRFWRRKVYEKYDYTCVCCKQRGGKLNAHHLNGYSWYEEGRYDVNNGVALCKSCHLDFHSKYGYGDNTKEQFEEYYKEVKVLIV